MLTCKNVVLLAVTLDFFGVFLEILGFLEITVRDGRLKNNSPAIYVESCEPYLCRDFWIPFRNDFKGSCRALQDATG